MSTPHKPWTPGAKRPDLFGAAPPPRAANPATEMRIDVLAALDQDAPKPSADKRRAHVALAVFAISFLALGSLGYLVWHAPTKPEAETFATADEHAAPTPASEPPAATPIAPAAPAQEAAPASVEPIAETPPAEAAEAPTAETHTGNPLGALNVSPDAAAHATSGTPTQAPSAKHQAVATQRETSRSPKDHPAQAARKHSGVLSALTSPQADSKGRAAPDTDVILLEALIANPAAKAIAHPSAKKTSQPANTHKSGGQRSDSQAKSGSTIAPEYQSAAQMVVTKATDAAENKASEAASQKASEAGDALLNKLKPAQ